MDLSELRDGDELRGRGLRFLLVDLIRKHETVTVAEMVAAIDHDGYKLCGRPSKVISDALRWELARGRVVRLGRGVYAYGRTPKTTARRIRLFAAHCRNWIQAVADGQQPPPTPPTRPDRRTWPDSLPEDPLRPPWSDYGWLWST